MLDPADIHEKKKMQQQQQQQRQFNNNMNNRNNKRKQPPGGNQQQFNNNQQRQQSNQNLRNQQQQQTPKQEQKPNLQNQQKGNTSTPNSKPNVNNNNVQNQNNRGGGNQNQNQNNQRNQNNRGGNQNNAINNTPKNQNQRNQNQQQPKLTPKVEQNNHHNNHAIQPQDDSYRAWKNNLPLLGAPTIDLHEKPRELQNKKFTGRCRLFVANLPQNITEDSLRDLFTPFGEVSEVYLGKGNSFAFVKMDTRQNAEQARNALDLFVYEGRTLRVRLAAHAAAIKVSNLTSMVTNELLEHAFSFFGEVERAVVCADDRGRSLGEGIVEFARKSFAQNAMNKCQHDSFLLTAIPQPVVVEPYEPRDEEEGFGERNCVKMQQDYRLEREVGPRFAEPGTFEHEFAARWKQLFEIERQKRQRLDAEIQEARAKLREQMEFAKTEHQTKMLREKLKEMEERTGKYQQRNLEEERRREEERQRQDMLIRQREEEILRYQQAQDYGSLRRQESDLMREASLMQDMLDRQEATVRQLEVNNGRGPYSGPVDPYGQAPPAFAVSTGAPPGHQSPMDVSRYPAQGGPWSGPMGPIHPAQYGGGGPGLPPGHPLAAGPAFGPNKRRRY